MLRADQALRVGDESLDPGGDRARLLLDVPPHRGYLTVQATPVLVHGSLNQTPALAKFTLYPGASPANLALEAIAGGGAATLVALELAVEGGAAAVLGGEPLDGRDDVVAR